MGLLQARHRTSAPVGGVTRLWAKFFPLIENGAEQVEVFDCGLCCHRGRRTRELCWDDILSIDVQVRRRGPPWRRRWVQRYHALLADGEPWIFTSALENFAALCRTLEERLLERRVPLHMMAFDAGQVLRFGTFSLDFTHLRKGRHKIAWAKVDRVTLEGASVVVREAGCPWTAVPCRKVRDLLVFLAVSRQAAGPMSPLARELLKHLASS